MSQIIEYKQAILVGAAPIGEEEGQLLSLLKWAGYEKKEIDESVEQEQSVESSNQDDNASATCNKQCNSCKSACAERTIQKNVYVIAADGGIKYLLEHNLYADYWIGDLDSLEKACEDKTFLEQIMQIPHEQVPVVKDDTDMALAAKRAYEMGYTDILMYGGLGGKRVSHTLANIQLLQYYAKCGCNIRMMGDGVRMEILRNAEKKFSGALKGSISVICLCDEAKGVEIKGLKYEYAGNLTSDVALGVSNSFVGKDASVSVEDGVLLLIYEKE